ncbi:SRPBCC family protein [Pedobacter sp. ASV12]|uniref:SRPBCC family protein n=1 Tax=Pedobacter sp. ASV12 TaxID=2795120 RepID=UPI0018EE2D7D|nr:SRPBCC domain-containing protein [Pedobacter sp. ASV12]
MSNKPVIVERTFAAPIARVWQAITDVNEMRNWYFQLKDFQPKVGFKFDFMGGPEEGPQYLHLCEVTEVEEGQKIAYSWRYDNYPGNSVVSWELFEQGEKTLLRITHAGLETLAENGPDFASKNFVEGWTYFLYTALKGYLEPEQN